jgi:hypothetical protein
VVSWLELVSAEQPHVTKSKPPPASVDVPAAFAAARRSSRALSCASRSAIVVRFVSS